MTNSAGAASGRESEPISRRALAAVHSTQPTSVPAGVLELEPATCAICGIEDADPVGVGEDFEYATAADTFLAVRCRHCNLVYLDPRPSAQEMSRIYPDDYHAFNFDKQSFGFVYRVRRRLEARRLATWTTGLPAHARILDVGCGDGFHLGLLKEFGTPSWTLEGIDTDARAVDVARQAQLNVHHGRVETLPLERGSYHLVMMIMTIEHLTHPDKVLAAVTDLLAPGGRLAIVTDNVGSPDFALFGGRHWGGYHFPRHFYLFDKETLARLATNTGLQLERIETSVSPVNWTYSFRNWLQDWGAPRWIVRRLDLKSTLAMSFFTLLDMPMAMLGRGGNLRATFIKP